jgi:hypothetical protein
MLTNAHKTLRRPIRMPENGIGSQCLYLIEIVA